MDKLKEHLRPSLQTAVSVKQGQHVYEEMSTYGRRRNVVLTDFNMDVNVGTMYALLGSSGCGKTTVLRAVVGQLRLTRGTVRVLGLRPGPSPTSTLPACLFGYMPQEAALPGALTIGEVLRFYGMLAGMTAADITAQLHRVTDNLELPPASTIIDNLSGGQKRRVSLAVALLSSPPMLVLDEPTVGVDPLLRNKIWALLLKLTASNRTTILLTTHHVEEARHAHMIGLMRHGEIAAQEPPAVLVASVGSACLEDAVVLLCMKQEGDKQKGMVQPPVQVSGRASPPSEQEDKVLPRQSSHIKPRVKIRGLQDLLFVQRHLLALLWKNVINVWRNKLSIAALGLLTVLIPWLTAMALDGFPSAVVGVVNEDADCSALSLQQQSGCNQSSALSCRYMDLLTQHGLTHVQFADVTQAEEAVRSGASWGVVYFQANFSSALVARIQGSTSDEVFHYSDIIAKLDMSNAVTSFMVTRHLSEATRELVVSLSCEGVTGQVLRVHEPVFGYKEATLEVDQRASLILLPIFLFSGMLGLSAVMSEKEEKSLERAFVAGVTRMNLLLSIVVVYLPIVLLQAGLHLLVYFVILAVPCVGSVHVVYSVTAIFSTFSFLFGLVCAVGAKSFAVSGMVVQTTFLVLVFVSGSVWPYEGMHWTVRLLSRALPMLEPTRALQGVLLRGWPMSHPQVHSGMVVAVLGCVAAAILLIAWALPTRRALSCCKRAEQ